MLDTTLNVTDATFEQEIERAQGLTIVDFHAPWCAPCRLIAPHLDAIAGERAGEVRVAKLNSDENPRTTVRFGVRSMPTLLFFKDGELRGRIVGAVPKARIEEAVAQYASG